MKYLNSMKIESYQNPVTVSMIVINNGNNLVGLQSIQSQFIKIETKISIKINTNKYKLNNKTTLFYH